MPMANACNRTLAAWSVRNQTQVMAQSRYRRIVQNPREMYVSFDNLEPLGELGRATTAYHEAAPDRMEDARLEYEEALRRFKATIGFVPSGQ